MALSTHHDALLRRLLRRGSARRTLSALLDAGMATDEQLAVLCCIARDASGWRWKQRGVVCGCLGAIAKGREQRARSARALVAAVNARDRGFGGRVQRLALRCGAAALSVSAIVAASTGQWWFALNPAVWVTCWVALLPPSMIASSWIENSRLRWIRREALASLGDLVVPGSLPAVARAANSREPAIRQAARSAIVPILGAATTDHYGRLSAAVPEVCRLLASSDPQIVLAAVESLGRFGDGRAVEPMERMLARGATQDAAAAAERALPELRRRREQEGTGARLLRPAADPMDGSTLLRAAGGAGPGDEELLLRAVEGEPE